MPEKKLPETKKSKTVEVKKTAAQKGPGILSERFPAVSDILTKSKNNISDKVLEATTNKQKETSYRQVQTNVSSLEKITDLAEEQNKLLREIINAFKKEDEGPSLPDLGGRRRGARQRPPGRSRFGGAAQQRLQRVRAAARIRTFQRAGTRAARAYTAVRRAAVSISSRVTEAAQRITTRVAPRPVTAVETPSTRPQTETPRARPSVEPQRTRPAVEAPRPAPPAETPRARPPVEAPRPAPAPETPRPAPAAPAERIPFQPAEQRPEDAEKVRERNVAGRRVTYNERVFNRTVAGLRFGGAVGTIISTMGIAEQVRELYALRQMNAADPQEGISEEDFLKELSNLSGGVLGGLAGGFLGAKIGAIIGGVATAGPWGALAGGVAGGIFGGLEGEQAGELIGAAIFDQLTGANRFEELWNKLQDEARKNMTAGASTLGAPPETEAERVVQEQQATEEQRQRQSVGIEEPFQNTELEKLIRDLQKAKSDLQNNPRNMRLQRSVENQEKGLRNLLNSPGFRASVEERERALRFLNGQTEVPAQRIENRDLETRLSASEEEDSDATVVDEEPERVAAQPIVRSLLREEEMESALPYPENLIEMIGRTEFDSIEIEADTIKFEGEIKLTVAEAVAVDTAIGGGSTAAPSPEVPPTATQTTAPSATMTGGATATGGAGGAGVAPAGPSQGLGTAQGAGTTAPAGGGEGASSLATPVAMPSPAATGIPPAPQPDAAPQQGQGGQAGGGDFMREVNRVSGRLGINPANLLAVMRSESSLNPRAVNSSTGASGLIQFMPRTAQSLGTSVEAIRQMSAAQQMPYVEKFFQSVRLPPGASAGKLYAYVFLPGRANREVLTQQGENFYEANKNLDVDKDGKITIADLDARLARYGAVGGAAPASMQAAGSGAGGALAAAGTGMVAADQAQARSGGQTTIVQAQNQQGPQAPVIGQSQPATGEVPLNVRLQRQAA